MNIIKNLLFITLFLICSLFAKTATLPSSPTKTLLPHGSATAPLVANAQISTIAPLEFDGLDWDLALPLRSPWMGGLHLGSATDGVVVHPLLGLEYRKLGLLEDHVWAGDGGVFALGNSGDLSFWFDARIFTESYEQGKDIAYDGDFILEQKDGDNGATHNYVSYSRFRGNFNVQSTWGNFGFLYDSPHWGPAYRGALTLNQTAVPYPAFYWNGSFGPVRLTSFWSPLVIEGPGGAFGQGKSRSLYAHRYEWSITENWVLGLSELLVTYENERPAAIAPIVPLFIYKDQGNELDNNGLLSVDLAWRIPRKALIYGEFSMDDFIQPNNLFDNYWASKWAATLGTHIVQNFAAWKTGAIVEWTRVEPWMYTYYWDQTAQLAHHGLPLGNELGPNSMAVLTDFYADWNQDLRYSLRMDWVWKGDDLGSRLNDASRPDSKNPRARVSDTKCSLCDVDGPDWLIRPGFGYRLGQLWLDAQLGLRDGPVDARLRAMWQY